MYHFYGVNLNTLSLIQGTGESVEANLRQYGLEHRYVDMVVADAASSIWRQQEVFDAIVTDRKLPLLSTFSRTYIACS